MIKQPWKLDMFSWYLAFRCSYVHAPYPHQLIVFSSAHLRKKYQSHVARSTKNISFGSEKWRSVTYWVCYRCRCIVDLLRNQAITARWRHRDLVTQFGAQRLHLRGMTTGAPPHMIPQHLAALGAGTSRRLPLCACCYQVIIGYNVWCPSHYMRGLGY
jgi:hypothetical protein